MKQLTQAAQAAKMIRGALIKQYPRIKFKVGSKTYAGGNSVTISWENGIVEETIESFANKFECGHFDGTEDLYHYTNRNDSIPQVKYVHCDRKITDEVYQKAYNLLQDDSVNLYRKLRTLDLTQELTLEMLKC